MIYKKEKLKDELAKIFDTGKSRLIKKYNLSSYDIHTIIKVINGEEKYILQDNVIKLLKDYGYEIANLGIGYEVVK